MDEVVLRPMAAEDLDQIEEMERLCFSTPWSRKAFEGELTNTAARYRVLTVGGQVRAYAGTWIILDEGHITNIAVHPDFQRRGYGEAVTRAMISAAVEVGVRVMTLEVRVSNAAAIALYRKLGFKKAGVRKRYYEDNGEDAYLMVCDWLPGAPRYGEEA